MFRNQYDNDTTVWSPQGRLFQVEYAMEAVKQGTVTVGLKSKDYAVLVALCRASSDVDSLQRKIMSVDAHMGISISGLTADARQLCHYLRTECMAYRHSYDTEYPIKRFVESLGNKMQATTQSYNRRPYGVGMLVAGYDVNGAHIYQVMPSATVLNCKSMAIGSRSQSARTYLERNMESFENCDMDELVCHGIQAIRGSLGNEDLQDLTINAAVVGKDMPFKVLTDSDNQRCLIQAKGMGKPVVDEFVDAFSEKGISDDDDEQGPSGSGMPRSDDVSTTGS
ncbi:proteasome subunit alpha type-1 [Drosophila serrata]|uniref:proteasome subunit alpha type-1 n=1 Tax=Drosophila serrata TaxID=7274 RepID=UPI000A1D2BFA|nr:proteasome subunit alpha type-1 [Drosophila serrata]